ncbi:YceH family protein [Gaiella sp.]|uniref:YceH family protein n=1 Tax=Gaiella sp. TaxID=2663207 RepID=UPI00326697F4
MDADPVEIRVLGCLIEKQRTTPDTYPLTLNSLRLACNQATNREPVVEYDEEVIREALQRLWRREWARLASGQGSRSVKYRQLMQETLGLADDEISVLCVLMLRGPQTPGELKQRTDRLHQFGELAAVEETLERLIGRNLVARLARRPGRKEERYAQLLGGAVDDAAEIDVSRSVLARDPLEERIAALEVEVAALRAALTDLGL